ncbi:MAG TPA: YbaN family protein [Mesorhizobium sp.]|nr:YbaN family protein [Mesorhizobium sp.]
MRLLWVGLGWACVLLGLIGMVLPLMPTTVFLLLAAWSFSRGSPRFHCWLTTHPHLGPPIRAWREHGAVSRQAKALAVVSLALSFGLAASMGAPVWALALCALCLSVVAAFLLTRPAPPRAR